MEYIIRISDRGSTKASLHDVRCKVVTGKQPPGYHIHKLYGTGPFAVIDQFAADEDFKARGIKHPKICGCVALFP